MKNIIKKSLVFVLSVAMALSFSMPAKKAQADTYDQVFEVSTMAELEQACNAINSASSGNFKINVNADLNGPGAWFGLQKNKTTIDGHNHTMYSNGHGGMLDVRNNGTEVTVEDITFEGAETGSDPGVFYVLDSGKLTMNDGVTIQNNTGDNYYGGGVTVQDATFIMNGGTIDNCGIDTGSVCYGGGVGVIAGGLFIMNGGTISNCFANSDYSSGALFSSMGGGVFVTGGSEFIMNDGEISDNEAYYFGGGVAEVISLDEIYEGGNYGYVYSNVTINGGTISGNSSNGGGGGVFCSGFYYCDGVPIGTSGPSGGRAETPGLFVNGGTITNNESYEGGGVYTLASRRPSKIHNATITNNYAEGKAAGVENDYYWSVMDIDGCTISGNETDGAGGGVLACRNGGGGSTTIKDSTITNNTSKSLGAGVTYDNQSRINIKGANTVQNNTYNGAKNNLNVLSESYPVYVTGSLTGSEIGLSDPVLWGDGISDEAATTAAAKLTSGYKTNNPSLVPKDAFTSDHKTWYPDYSADGNEVRLVKKTNNSKIRGGNILVDGLIGVTLWVELDATTEAEREAYSMQFTLDDHTGSGVVQTAEYDSTKTAENPSTGDTYYGFTFEDVKAPQMADEITAELLQDGDATGVEKEYSVEQYAENMINKDNTKQDYKDFLKPMLNYGAFAQKYFNYNKSDLANKNNDMSDTVYEQTVDSKYEMSTEGGLSGIAVKHFGMALNDGVDLHFEFTADSNVNMDEYTAVLNDDPNKEPMFIDDNDQPTHELVMPFTELETQGVKTYYVNVYNIPAHRYDDTMTVTLYKKSDPATTFKIHFSVLSYAYEIIEKDADVPEGIVKEDLVNLLKSMVLYNVWAEKYFNKYPGEYIRTKRVITEKA